MALPQIQKILVAFDGSQPSERACEMASLLAKDFEAKILLAHVLPPASILTARTRTAFETSVRERAENEIVKMQAKLEQEYGGIKVRTRILQARESIPGSLVDLAHSEEADLIVAGTRGMGAFKRMVLGSISTALLNLASSTCPVLIVRSKEGDAEPPQLRKILAATDGSKSAANAVKLAASIASFSGAELTIAYVVYIQPGAYSGGYVPVIDRVLDELRSEGKRIVSEAVRVANESEVAAHGELIDVNRGPVWALTEFADEGKFDLIVTGTRGQTNLRRTLLGSVANGIAHYASCSVLVTK